jgi:hypothetical protein
MRLQHIQPSRDLSEDLMVSLSNRGATHAKVRWISAGDERP